MLCFIWRHHVVRHARYEILANHERQRFVRRFYVLNRATSEFRASLRRASLKQDRSVRGEWLYPRG